MYNIISEILNKANSKPSNWRYGQAIFNYAFDILPYEVNLLRGTTYDCFYNNEKVDIFLEKLSEMILKINIIFAGAQINGIPNKLGIGNKNSMPWNSKLDMKWFKDMTCGNIVIMGKNTFNSIGKPLKDRINIVIDKYNQNIEGCFTATDLNSSILLAKNIIKNESDDELKALKHLMGQNRKIFIIGGGKIFKEAISNKIADNIFIDIMNEMNYSDFDTFVDINEIIDNYTVDSVEMINDDSIIKRIKLIKNI